MDSVNGIPTPIDTTAKKPAVKRGRPPKNGKHSLKELERVTFALRGYDLARSRGEKHSAAVTETVMYVRSKAPKLKISETEVRRILAEWRPQNESLGFSVDKPPSHHSSLTIPGFGVFQVKLMAAYGPRQTYPRTNAASLKTK